MSAAAAAAAAAASAATTSVAAAAAAAHRAYVLSLYRELLALVNRLGPADAAAKRREARATLRERARACAPDSAEAQAHARELAARVSFLRITAPRPPGSPLGPARGAAAAATSGGGKTTYVMRGGKLVAVGGGGGGSGDGGGEGGEYATAAAAAASKGRRAADGSIGREEAFRRNAEHYKRFTGKEWRRNNLFF